ncbi:PREDICTED: integrin alpha-V-like [Amphimedon queenslandica]|uniref:Uncharacterized protein n=1 Tax=Amphimedon queenslandica TaxID=400682 RepID=A0A1X7VKZ8_AMPQE|nr:PREDICTED: integrin alpha-V-like [Amphimedon queenslandica]|eukprot:XP_003383673.2 PREDICTED: integrin alpha-V-like [Amphimedon queenslandica]
MRLFLLSLLVGLSIARLDVLKPIVKRSPAAGRPASVGGGSDDQFGFSAVVHQLFEDSTGMSFSEIIDQTVIISGAPRGVYPGGLDLPLDYRACQRYTPAANCSAHNAMIMNYTDEQIIDCYRELRNGLVYSCPLSSGECSALASNDTVEGRYPFDSVGDYTDQCQTELKLGELFSIKNQKMGMTLFSNGSTFLACSPLLVNYLYLSDGSILSHHPSGRCVISGRNLQGFKSLTIDQCNVPDNGVSQHAYCLTGFNKPAIFNSGLVFGQPLWRIQGAAYYFSDPLQSPGSSVRYSRAQTSNFEQYFGYAVATGNLFNKTITNTIISAPIYHDDDAGKTLRERAFIYEDRSIETNIFVNGSSSGEYFGYTLATADLNGDGFDDLLVGAPMYSNFGSPIRTLLGRVYIFTAINNTLTLSKVLQGTEPGGQFGLSVEPIGDTNNDGYDDFAVSAPYEGNGFVYIYYGQEMDESGSIVNTTYQQRINGSAVASQVTDIPSVSSFGFSLSGGTDVDQNGYRDLVIGAYESQSVFVLRTIPVAITNISMTFNTEQVMLQDYDCVYQGNPVACFIATLCSQYEGKGLPSGFSANYTFEEVTGSGQAPRLMFQDGTTGSSIRGPVTYTGPGIPACYNITIFVSNTTISSDISDLLMRATILDIPTDTSPVNTNSVPVDFSASPDIRVSPVTEALQVSTQCGNDFICDSDLQLRISNVIYRKSDPNQLSSDQSQIVIGDTSFVDLIVSLTNVEEDAFNSYLVFDLTNTYFSSATSPNSSITCTLSSDNITQYTCTGIKSPLKSTDPPQIIAIRLTLISSIRGNEDPFDLVISAAIPEQQRNRENDTFLSDNSMRRSIAFAAVSSYTLNMFFIPNTYTYSGARPAALNNISSNLGDRLSLRVSLRNSGPSPYRGYLNIYIPARKPSETASNYYYYPVKLAGADNNLNCASNLNPNNYNTDNVQSSGLQGGAGRRRSRRNLSYLTPKHHNALRIRQTEEMETTFNLDCQATPMECMLIQCNVSLLASGSVISLEIIGFIDERFFQGQTTDYNLKAYVEGDINDGFTVTANSSRDSTANMMFVRMVQPTGGGTEGSFPYLYIIIPVVLAIIFIIILAIALYCLGFFKRRKKAKKEQEEMDPYEDDYNPNDDETKDSKEM